MTNNTGPIKFIGFVLFLLSFISCNLTKEDAKKYLPGDYFYEVPTGEIQQLTIKTDFTFKQIVYSKGKENILYQNEGELQVDGTDIVFKNWLECYELASQKMLSSPYLATSFRGAFWTREKGTGNILIVAFDETNYVFRKR